MSRLIDFSTPDRDMVQMLGGYRPFFPPAKCLKVDASFPPLQWSAISPEAVDLCRGLLQRDPKLRYTARQALDHPWITKSLAPMPLPRTNSRFSGMKV